MPDLPNPTELAVPFFVGLVLLEMIFGRVTGAVRYEPRDTATSLLMGLGSTIAGATLGVIVGAYVLWMSQFAVFDIGWAAWAWVVCFIGDDFLYYWSHRWAHRVRWFWASHVIHHSSQHYNLSTALRQTWTGTLTLRWIVLAPGLALIGFPPLMIAFCGGLNLVYQFWIHTEAIKRLPAPIEWVMNTPSHHRVHHATNPRYLDANYAGVFIIWDRMFGSFAPERDDEPCRYGIVKNVATFNPLKVAFHEWLAILSDVAKAKTWRERIGYVAGAPGWSPDASRETTAMIKARWRAETGASAGEPPATAHDAPSPAPAE